jgi:membrane-associated phospholipid phosphatase
MRTIAAAALSLIALAGPARVWGQETEIQKTVLVPKDALIFSAFALGSIALTTADSRIAHWFQAPSQQNNGTMSRLAKDFTKIQETRLTVAGLATYAIGRLSKSEPLADIGLHTTEAIFVASIASQVIRGPLGRSRPHLTNFDDPYDFKAFAGFREFNYRAYPSIHASSAFAAATVVVMETSRRNPRANWYVVPIAYSVAVLPSYSRMYLGQHWASDIFMGAFMGTFTGLRVVKYSHEHADNKVDRFLLGNLRSNGLRVSGDSRGMTIQYGRTF